MNPRIKSVKANQDYTLNLFFENGEERVFDCRPYLDIGVFKELKELPYFFKATVQMGTVSWPHEQDFCPDTLYIESKAIKSV
ncbi:MAG TPA: DUF2442 domain-containing protein [Candidatus Ozemobacteraceae bacterium]|nr:DUF2442 domain-containing protein [Candidatus Ozemobacteraceae bacterium]